MSDGSPEETTEIQPEPKITISIYGGKKDEVMDSVSQHLAPDEEASVYETWINVRALRSLGFLFVGGVESAGGLFEVVCMFVVLAVILALFVLWNLIVFFLVLVVLAVLSGGRAIKYMRGTFIEADVSKIDTTGLDAFVKAEVIKGRYIEAKAEDTERFGEITRTASSMTRLFRLGINWAMIVATAFLIFELVYRFFTLTWSTDFWFLLFFGITFLVGVVVMDIGILKLRRSAS